MMKNLLNVNFSSKKKFNVLKKRDIKNQKQRSPRYEGDRQHGTAQPSYVFGGPPCSKEAARITKL